MDKSNVIVYAEGLAKEKNLSDKQKNELIETLTEATSVLGDDKERIEEALSFLDDKIQNSYKQFFTDTGIVATEIRSTTMIKVEEIIKEVEQIKIAQERADRQAANPNEMINSYIDKAMNMDVKEADLFNLPEAEVVASIKGALTTYFDGLDLPKGFLEDLSKDMYDAKKREAEIEALVEAGEKREDVEAKMFPDEESRLKHGADVEIYDETAEEEYVQTLEAISAISVKYGITFQEAEDKFFENKSDASRYKYTIESQKYRTKVNGLEDPERTDGVKDAEDPESDNRKIHALSGFGKKFDGCTKYITEQQRKLQYLEGHLENARKEGNGNAIALFEKACETCRSNIESYQKILARLQEKSKKREAGIREDFEFYKRNKGEVERLMREQNLTVEAAASKVFGFDLKEFGRYIRINASISSIEAREQKQEIERATSDKYRGLNIVDIKIYAANKKQIIEMDKKIAELEGYLANSRAKGNTENIAMFEKQIAGYREKRNRSLSKINELEKKSESTIDKNVKKPENDGQTRGTSQLVVEEIATGGENKKSKPFSLFKGLFGKRRTIQAGIKSAYDDLAVAQTAIKSQETEQEIQSPQIQENQPTNGNNTQQSTQGDKGSQDEQVL